ncbi:MAG: DUF2029 domain-containing protein [Oligoflexia bacterium]|nr:DUF2029 domain-containing protein [Oligoflexia bacterium]MBF0366203.1 DUF2029 domain-containing protein [Oligoflexia bacterium]
MNPLIATLFVFALYTCTQLLYAAYNPWWRFALLAIFIPFIYYRNSLLSTISKLKSLQWQRFFLIIMIVLLCFRLIHFAARYAKPTTHIEDVAILNYDAVQELFRAHRNPYAGEFDPYPVDRSDGTIVHYPGYKYPPLQLVYYAPFMLLLGIKGVFVANLFCYLMLVFIIYALLSRRGLPIHASLAAIAFLSTDFLFTLSFNKGTNDLPGTLFAFLAFASARSSSATTTSGIFLGLSLLMKQLPGGLLALIFLLKRQWHLLIVATLLFCIAILPFLLFTDPYYFYRQVVEFVFVRPARETSWLLHLSPWWQKLVQLLGIVTIATLALSKQTKKQLGVWGLATLAITLFLLTSKMAPSHYFVWALPFTVMWFFEAPAPSKK